MFDALKAWFLERTPTELAWLLIGLLAQALFTMRFVVQWIASERIRRSIVPETFWYFSLGGGVMLLGYAIHKADPVFILGQGAGLVIYSRNVYFIWTHKRAAAAPGAADPAKT